MNEFLDAIKVLLSRGITPSTLNYEQWQKVAPAIRQKAFFSATVNSAKTLTAWREMLLDWLDGATEEIPQEDGPPITAYKEVGLAKFRERGADFAIKEGLATEADFQDQKITNVISNARLALVFNTNTEQAREFAYYKNRVGDPEYINSFPAAKFGRRPGGNPKHFRPLHVANEGEVRRWDDLPFWLEMNNASIGGFEVPWGPWGFNSYMRQEPVSRKTAEKLGLVRPGEVVRPPDLKRFGADIGSEFLGDYEESLGEVPEDIARETKKRLVDRLGPSALDSQGKPSLKALKEARDRLRLDYS